MPDIDADDVPVAYNDINQGHITWNTHVAIREFFGYPVEDEFFGDWLVWFYELLNPQQRIMLRNTPLETLNMDDFIRPPTQGETQ